MDSDSISSISNEESKDSKYDIESKSSAKNKCSCFNLNNDSDEQTRLGSHPTLITLLRLSVGPLCSQVVTSMYLMVDIFWISRTIGKDGLTATGSVNLLEAVNNSFGFYLSTCIAARLSYLYGQQRKEECAQVFIDMIRISWIFSIILPIIILNVCKPITGWFGADEHIQNMGFQYLIPISGITVVYEMYQICCGLLQSEGLSWIYGTCQICSLVLNMIALDPLFLVVFKLPIWGASLASIIASFIPLVILLVLIFRGTFTIKPKFNMFFKKGSPETKSALKMGLSTLIQFLSGNIPEIFLQKWLGNSGKAIGKYNEVISSMNVVFRVYMFVICFDNGIMQGLLPSASFAFGAQKLKRLRNLTIHALWIGTAWTTLCEIIIITNSRSIAKIWLSDDDFLDFSEKFFFNGLIAMFTVMTRFVSLTVLQACKKIVISIVLSFITLLIPLPLFSTILYLTDKKNPTRLFYCYMMNDVFAFVVCLTVVIFTLPFLFKRNPDSETNKVFNETEKKENEKEEYYLSDSISTNETNTKDDQNTNEL